jgi:hypothetical protein
VLFLMVPLLLGCGAASEEGDAVPATLSEGADPMVVTVYKSPT